MPEPPPAGVLPLFLRGVTAEKYGFKIGEGITDLVDMILLKKEDVMKEIQGLGVMSDFEPAKQQIDSYPGEEVLFVVDKQQVYGEMFLCCYTEDAKEVFLAKVREEQEAIEAQKRAVEEAEAARIAAEFARLNQVFEDKPISPRGWNSLSSYETEQEIQQMTIQPLREKRRQEISRPKRLLKQNYRFLDRDAKVGGVAEYKPAKDLNFKPVREADVGFQASPLCVNSFAQTNWNRPVSKAIQCGPATAIEEPVEEHRDAFFAFLEKAIMNVETALQQNESVDIFNETFQIVGEDDAQDGTQAENELREVKNFADPTYSKSKALVAIDWLPKSQGLLAVSAVRNVTFEQRTALSGHTASSYVLLWDFKQLVRPAALLQCHHEVLAFRFNKTLHGITAGGCITGQVVLWDIAPNLASAGRKGRGGGGEGGEDDDSADLHSSVSPKYISSVDHSHKRPVADLFWLPPTTQINYRGQLVGDEHLDGNSYQFVTISGDGMVMVWDTRYEKIAADELRFIGKSKHIPIDKAASKSDKESGNVKYLWGPIFKAPLKRLDGAGELSLLKVCCSGNLKPSVASQTAIAGDFRSHLVIGTEEGDVLLADLCVQKSSSHQAGPEDEEDHAEETVREFVRWCRVDHSRPAVSIEQSPYFTDVVLTVSDWGFNLWKVRSSLFSLPTLTFHSPLPHSQTHPSDSCSILYKTGRPRTARFHFAAVQHISHGRLLVPYSPSRAPSRVLGRKRASLGLHRLVLAPSRRAARHARAHHYHRVLGVERNQYSRAAAGSWRRHWHASRL